MMTKHMRSIGPFGTFARAIVGLGLLLLASLYFGITWRDVALGLVAFPAMVLLVQWLRLRYTSVPLRATGPLAHCVNCGIAALLFVNPYTGDAASVFYGASMLLAAARGYAGCEVLAISNALLRRDDEIGCALFAPVDVAEARASSQSGTSVQI